MNGSHVKLIVAGVGVEGWEVEVTVTMAVTTPVVTGVGGESWEVNVTV